VSKGAKPIGASWRTGLPTWPGWNRLPREPRDTLFQLGVIGWTMLPHATHLAPWCTTLAALLLVWRATIALTGGALPRRWAVLAVMAIATGLTVLTERTLLGKEAGVTMLVVLLALKTLELRGRRDALVIFFLGFFLVLTQCLYSQSLFVAASMAISTWGLLTAQVLSSMPVGKPSLRRAGAIAARSALLGLPLMAMLFLLFPRIGPLWGLPQDAIGRTGLSGTLRLGGLAEVANDDGIALRVRFQGEPPPSAMLYFRGPVLTHFDGDEWRSTAPSLDPAPRRRPELRLAGIARSYELIVEPIRLPLLPLLEVTPPPADDAILLPGWTALLDTELRWQIDRPVAERLRLSAIAWTRFEHGPQATLANAEPLTRLPAGRSPRAVAWARQLRSQPHLASADADMLAAELLAHIRNQGFSYTLAPGDYGREAIDEFWFDRRQGFCEHFAASFTVLMRAMGVPARIVTGYQGAEPMDDDGWQVVRQSNAHAWVEYWLPGRGWRRVDPTAAVAPDRIAASRSLPPVPGLMTGALRQMNPELARQLRRAWELLDNRWNLWVMGYSRSRQFDLLKSLGFESPSWRELVLALAVTTSAVALAAAAWAWWDRRRVDPWVRLHTRIRALLGRLGVACAAHEGPRALAQRVRRQLGAGAEALAQSLDELDRLRYGPQARGVPGRAWSQEFERRVAACRASAPGGPAAR